jgi:hypothetical protein
MALDSEQYMNGLGTAVVSEGYKLFNDQRYLDAAKKCGGFLATCSNVGGVVWGSNKSLFGAWGLASLYEITGEQKYLDRAVEFALYALSGQLPSGVWADDHDHDQQIWYHGIITRGLVVLLSVMPTSHPDYTKIEQATYKALNHLRLRQKADGTLLITPSDGSGAHWDGQSAHAVGVAKLRLNWPVINSIRALANGTSGLSPMEPNYNQGMRMIGFGCCLEAYSEGAGNRRAGISADPTSGEAPLTVSFDNTQIKHLSDPDLFGAIDLGREGLEEVRSEVERDDYAGAFVAWARYWVSRRCAPPSPRRGGRMESAEKILAGEIRGWGNVTIKHGPVVDFNADYGSAGKYGFHYWGWSWPLIRAYEKTGDEKYLEGFERLFNQWYEQRDKVEPQRVIWYELGLGIRNRTFIAYYLLPQTTRKVETHQRILKTLLAAGRWLYEEERARGYRSGNWQTHGCLGLIHIGLKVPEFAEAARWVALGVQRMREHAEKDFFADGCHSERVPTSYMLGVYGHIRETAELIGQHEEYKEKAAGLCRGLVKTLEWWAYTTTPLGDLPAINDGSRSKAHARLLASGADAFDRPEVRYVAKTLCGRKVAGECREPRWRSVNFADSGFAVMRSDWTRDARYLGINYGPSGGWHSHRDCLSFELYAFGRALAIDAGIGRTYDDPNHRSWYVTSKAHNQVVVEDANLERSEADGRPATWATLGNVEFFAAEHMGYAKNFGVTIRRSVVFVRPDYWVMFDRAMNSGEKERKLSWYFHSPYGLAARGAGFATRRGVPGILVLPADGSVQTSRTGRGWASVRGLGLGKAYEQIDWVAFDKQVASGEDASYAMLLAPYRTAVPDASIRLGGGSGRGAHIVVVPSAGADIEDHFIFADPARMKYAGNGIMLNGLFAFVRLRAGRPVAFSAVRATKLGFGGEVLLEAAETSDLDG